ncbi:MAG: glycosyltransferase [Desulfobacterales bacterium]|nr:glycosyltransferase [Desulfobacterales bacterium]MDD3081297.1 glycosyltransferase [Desulfobacterales bacterium]MDD3950710.1 glycosyltransferase [Desulfobacterales bacterium]MDD4464332.1 glycosyltransferase [Desulfobacterales bacterium]
MTKKLEKYAEVVGENIIGQLRQLAEPLRGMRVVHINSTREGGGVAEILHRLIPLNKELGLNATWEVITGDADFYQCTKKMHNALQGDSEDISEKLYAHYERINAQNHERLSPILSQADFVVIHDPQPAALLQHYPERKGKWVWRCHVDASRPHRPVWRYLQKHVNGYDAAVYSLPAFAQPMRNPLYIIPPSIDPLSDKNVPLPAEEIDTVRNTYDIDPERPVICQISRFDRFKDPMGVIKAYQIAKAFGPPLQLILAGGGAADDPEGETVFKEVQAAAAHDPDIHLLMLPPDAHRTINALQRIADIVVQKSLKEGFGLTVTEALWKGKPVIGGNVGGIRIQVVNHTNGFLVNSPEGAALRIRYLLSHADRMVAMGKNAKAFVIENYLLTRHLREYLTLMLAVLKGSRDRIELSSGF